MSTRGCNTGRSWDGVKSKGVWFRLVCYMSAGWTINFEGWVRVREGCETGKWTDYPGSLYLQEPAEVLAHRPHVGDIF